MQYKSPNNQGPKANKQMLNRNRFSVSVYCWIVFSMLLFGFSLVSFCCLFRSLFFFLSSRYAIHVSSNSLFSPVELLVLYFALHMLMYANWEMNMQHWNWIRWQRVRENEECKSTTHKITDENNSLEIRNSTQCAALYSDKWICCRFLLIACSVLLFVSHNLFDLTTAQREIVHGVTRKRWTCVSVIYQMSFVWLVSSSIHKLLLNFCWLIPYFWFVSYLLLFARSLSLSVCTFKRSGCTAPCIVSLCRCLAHWQLRMNWRPTRSQYR